MAIESCIVSGGGGLDEHGSGLHQELETRTKTHRTVKAEHQLPCGAALTGLVDEASVRGNRVLEVDDPLHHRHLKKCEKGI